MSRAVHRVAEVKPAWNRGRHRDLMVTSSLFHSKVFVDVKNSSESFYPRSLPVSRTKTHTHTHSQLELSLGIKVVRKQYKQPFDLRPSLHFTAFSLITVRTASYFQCRPEFLKNKISNIRQTVSKSDQFFFYKLKKIIQFIFFNKLFLKFSNKMFRKNISNKISGKKLF